MTVRLGPFQLDVPVGRGGMGEVWRASLGDRPVAVKVLTSDRARHPRWLALFRAELRAIAGLDHPHVIALYDQGLVEESGAEAGLVPGSPWLAMPFAAGGSLQPWLGRLPWRAARSVLLQLLDGLGHAHAAGIVHGDVKPENVLLRDRRDGDPSIWLTDFGLAHAIEGDGAAIRGGTPQYMAPEQGRKGGDFGPWTDLYGVGRVAMALATGRPRDDEPCIALPEGFSAWVARLVQPRPIDRWERAADAAMALLELPDVDDVAPGPLRPSTPMVSSSTWLDDLPEAAHSPEVAAPVDRRTAPLPEAQPEKPLPSRDGLGAGLGLWGLRAVRLVDRAEQREALWGALREVSTTGKPVAIVLEGPEGCGKSRLAEWLARRAHEAGAAAVVRADHGPTGARHEGLSGLVSRALRCAGRGREQALHAAAAFVAERGLPHDEGLAIAEIAHPLAEDAPGVRVRFGAAFERYATVERFLRALVRPYPEAGPRVALVWLDDVAWGLDAIGLARHLLAADLPALIVLTVHEDALADRPVEAAALATLTEAGARRLRVGPLAAEDRPRLVRELLALDEGLAQRVVDRTDGNALFAVQLLGDWVQRGLLAPGPSGLTLAEGAAIELPDDLYAVWADRLARLPDGDDARAIEVAAVLGHTVDDDEWRAACQIVGVTPSEALREALFGRRLAVEAEGGWAFVHPMLREAVVRRATSAGTLLSAHLACAEALEAEGQATAERRGRHLAAAGRFEEAVEPTFQGIAELRIRGLPDAAEAATAELERILRATGRPDTDPLWGWYWLTKGRNARIRRRMADSIAWLERAVSTPRLEGAALVELSRCEMLAGGFDAAHRYAERAEASYRERNRPDAAAEALLQRVEAWIRQGRFEEAEAAIERIRPHVVSPNVAYILAREVANLKLARQDLEGALAAHEALLLIADEQGHRPDAGTILNALGECARRMGDIAGAEVYYRRSLERMRSTKTGEAIVPQANLGLLLVADGRTDEGRVALERALEEVLRQRRPAVEVPILAGLLGCVLGEPDLFDAHLARIEELVATRRLADRDVAEFGERALKGLPEGPRADRLRRLVIAQWEGVGDSERASSLRTSA